MTAQRTKLRSESDPACPKTPITIYVLTKSMTWNFAKKLPTLGVHYKAIPEP